MNEQAVLEKFLKFDLSSVDDVFTEFSKLDNAVYYRPTLGSDDFVYVPGTREDRVVLIAHADTSWSKGWGKSKGPHDVTFEGGRYKSVSPSLGIGADDRAGCAMLYLMKDLGHSLLVTNGEEIGQLGAGAIRIYHNELYDVLNSHQYMLEFDLGNARNYKVYNIPVTEDFQSFVEENTGYGEAGKNSRTDIVPLCDKICGANLSIGYYDWHTKDETLVYSEWANTLHIGRELLEGRQEKFPVATTPRTLR